jgi:hypothetical protein
VIRQVRYESGDCLELEIDGKVVNVPRWMTRDDLCFRFTCGLDPVADFEALCQVLRLLDEHQS